MPELVAYYSFKQGMHLSRGEIAEALRGRLPAYMVPAFLEELPFIPMLISSKADHKKLPKPKGPRCQASTNFVAPRSENERILADALAGVLKAERISVEDHFFNELGAHSLLMARFCARIRQTPGMSNVSMRDIYQNPTIAKLAVHLEGAANENFVAPARPEPVHEPSDLSYYTCGALQLLFYAGYGLLMLKVAAVDLDWTYRDIHSPLDLFLRGIVAAAATFAFLTALPIAAKWLLLGKWKEERFPIWSLRYYRFWVVKTLVRSAPLAALPGSPLYNLYLRALGAKIGRGAVINCRFMPVATDLLSVGDNAVVRKDSIVLGYRARANFIEIGPVEIGKDAFVGEASVLDIGTAIGDRGQLGHASSLQSGQRVSAGKRYHGSPAVETTSNYCPVAPMPCSTLRRAIYAALQVAGIVAVAAPLSMLALNYWYDLFAYFTGVDVAQFNELTPAFLAVMLVASAVVSIGGLLIGLAGIYAVPRLCNMFLEPGRVYVMYGLHYWLQSVVSVTSNSRFYNVLFGDSSFIVHYMRFVGWKLNKVEQTGSNFGTNQRHDNPFLCEIGSGTMVSDGLSMINMHMSASSFVVAPARIGEHNYLGNDIHYPPDGRTGANCLLATKVMIPIDGPVRENVGLLGSPAFEIPRMVERDKGVNAALGAELRRQRVASKNWHNLWTAALFLITRWAFVFSALFLSHLGIENYPIYGTWSLLAAATLVSLVAVGYFAAIERASLGFGRLKPEMVSIYDPYFWMHERHWKLSDSPIIGLFAGTPFKNIVSRLVGIRIGRKVYDGGCSITERTLTEIGDGVNLNEGSVLQAHSLEEGVFKSDHIKVGYGSTLGAGAFVHYGVTMGEHVQIDADSFLMKGEVLDDNTVWRGNPAKLVRVNRAQPQVVGRTAGQQSLSADDLLDLNVAASVPAE
jgi:non-ribosomal peptide synthetase-like protein